MSGNATVTAGEAPHAGSAPRSPGRVMGVIEALALRPDGLSLASLSRSLRLPKTSLFNLLRALEHDSYVVNAQGAYRLGPAALRLGSMIGGGAPGWRRIGVLLPALAARCGETALLAVPTEDRQEVLYVDIADGPEAIRFAAVVGTRRPLYNTAAGRIVLAYSDDAFVQAYLSAPHRRAYTPRTTTSRQALRTAIEQVRGSGIAETHDQSVVGLWGFGAPVLDADRRLVAAVMIAAPAERARPKRAALVSSLRRAGEEMSRILGLSGAYVDAE
ncbi:MAG TPA: IclR family transcriptional regulator [Vineibacter sp.]|nr:IclR family transcriptional regulator [Vineibacter sp.]